MRDETNGQLTHDREQLGLDPGLEPAVQLEGLRDEVEEPLRRPVEPSDDLGVGRAALGGERGRSFRLLPGPPPLDEIDDPAHAFDGRDAL